MGLRAFAGMSMALAACLVGSCIPAGGRPSTTPTVVNASEAGATYCYNVFEGSSEAIAAQAQQHCAQYGLVALYTDAEPQCPGDGVVYRCVAP